MFNLEHGLETLVFYGSQWLYDNQWFPPATPEGSGHIVREEYS